VSSNRVPRLRVIWSPRDAVTTAEEFAASIDQAEVGQLREECRLFSRSRPRRAAVMDGVAVALLLALMALIGAAAYFMVVPR